LKSREIFEKGWIDSQLAISLRSDRNQLLMLTVIHHFVSNKINVK